MSEITYRKRVINKSIYLKALLSYIESNQFEYGRLEAVRRARRIAERENQSCLDTPYLVILSQSGSYNIKSSGHKKTISRLDRRLDRLELILEPLDSSEYLDSLIEDFNRLTEDENKIYYQDIDSLEEFLSYYGDRYADIWEHGSSGTRSSYSATIGEIFTDEKISNFEDGSPAVENFELTEDGCEFNIGYTSYTIGLSYRPTDKWGNSYDPNDGYDSREGFYELYYTDYSGSFYSDEWLSAVDSEITLDWEPRASFEDWFQANHTRYHFIDLITQSDTYSGCAGGFEAIVTNKDPRNSEEWKKLFEDFRNEVLATV